MALQNTMAQKRSKRYEEAAKLVISAGLVVPKQQAQLEQLAKGARAPAKKRVREKAPAD